MDVILSQRTSKNQQKDYAENQRIGFKVPTGKLLKSFLVQITGYFTPGFSSAPSLNPLGLMDALVNSISYVDGNGNVIKNVTPAWMRDQARMLVGSPAPELYQVNSQTLTTPKQGTVATPFEIGTTGQKVAFRTCVEVIFENKLSTAHSATYQSTDGRGESYIYIDCNKFAAIEKAGGSNLTSCTGVAKIDITLREAAPELVGVTTFDVFRQANTVHNVSGQLNNQRFEISRSGRIQGLRFAMRHGSDKAFISPELAKDVMIKLYANGRALIQEASLQDLIDINACSRMQDVMNIGVGYMYLLNNQDYNTALNAEGFSTLWVEVSTPSGITYSPSATFEIGTDEILPMLKK